MAADPIVTAKGLTRRFGGVLAVDDLSFEVMRGELFGIVGPDGAGKTTTLRMLAGVLRASGGDATVAGHSVSRDREGLAGAIAYMPQRFGLYGDLTVAENLDFYADLYLIPRRERAARLERHYEFSRLGPFRERLAGKLSGGMKQKLGLSCALIHEPEVLLLDEPTFGVDPISRRELWLIIHERVAAGVTAIVSTSYMDEAERFDRIAFLDQGKRIALDTPVRLRKGLRGDLVDVRLPRAREAKPLCESLPSVRRAVVFGERLHLTVGSAESDLPIILERLRRAGFEVASARRIEPGLEDIFIELVDGTEAAA